MHTIKSLTRSHLRQFLRTQRNVPPTAVPRLKQLFAVCGVGPAPSHDGDGRAMPFGVEVTFSSSVPCSIQAFWGVERHAVGALQRGGGHGLLQRNRRKAAERAGRRQRAAGGGGAGAAYQKLQEAKNDEAPLRAADGEDGAVTGAATSEEGPLLFPPAAFISCSPPQQ